MTPFEKHTQIVDTIGASASALHAQIEALISMRTGIADAVTAARSTVDSAGAALSKAVVTAAVGAGAADDAAIANVALDVARAGLARAEAERDHLPHIDEKLAALEESIAVLQVEAAPHHAALRQLRVEAAHRELADRCAAFDKLVPGIVAAMASVLGLAARLDQARVGGSIRAVSTSRFCVAPFAGDSVFCHSTMTALVDAQTNAARTAWPI